MLFSCFALAGTLIFSGCNPELKQDEPGQMLLHSSETLQAVPEQVLPEAVHLELLSRPVPGLLKKQGSPKPLKGKLITALPLEGKGKPTISPTSQLTDAGGSCKFDVTFSDVMGDSYLDFFVDEAPEIKKRVRLVSGVTLANNEQEVIAGKTIAEPIQIRLNKTKDLPASDVTVHFTLISQPGKKAYIYPSTAQTDENGMAEVFLKTESRVTGVYEIAIEVADPQHDLFVRPVSAKVMAISLTKTLLGVLGGLAIFIFGITLLSDGLQQVAGNKMKTALSFVTRNRVTGILAGAFLATAIQSSSLTTVMTVGFVNAGLLTLRQAIGVVFGANIGTTITGQMVSFNLIGFAQPALVIGVILLVISRTKPLKGIARAVLGFGFLSFGMTLMSTELKLVSAFPSFINFFQMFDCTPIPGGSMPLLSVLGALGIGTAVTVLVQSSAATIGLTIALAGSGLLNIWTAIPIVLGDNIGTTITALLASINTNRTARQTAMAHSMFNVLGSLVIIVSFYIPIAGHPSFIYLVDRVTSGNVFMGENIGRHVAMAHSLFNIVNVIIMTPLIGVLAWICEKILPGKTATSQTVRLEKNLLNTPPLALFCAMRALADMTEKAWKAAATALQGYKDGQPADVEEIEALEEEVDTYQTAISDYLVQLTRKDLTEKQAGAIPALMHCVNDAERIADLALLIAKRAASQTPQKMQFSDSALEELETLFNKAFHIAELTRESLQDKRLLAKTVEDVVEDLNELADKSTGNHVNRLQQGLCTPERGLVYVEVVAALTNMVRHLENIAQRSDILTEAAS